MRPLFASFKVRVGVVVVLFVFGILMANTVGEFLVALHNRYSVYLVGTDTNMYGNSAAVAILFMNLVCFLCMRLLRKKIDLGTLIISFVFAFISLIVVGREVFPSFIPAEWCKYELTIYPCADAPQAYYQDSNIGKIIYYSK